MVRLYTGGGTCFDRVKRHADAKPREGGPTDGFSVAGPETRRRDAEERHGAEDLVEEPRRGHAWTFFKFPGVTVLPHAESAVA